MNEQEKLEYMKDMRDAAEEWEEFATRRAAELHDSFAGLQIQIAAVLFAFCGLFVDKFTTAIIGFSALQIDSLKFDYAAVVFLLVVSFALGLIHLNRKEKFWNVRMRRHVEQYLSWNAGVRGDKTIEDARAFHNGTVAATEKIEETPKWPWILQSITLALAIILLFVLFIAFLIHS